MANSKNTTKRQHGLFHIMGRLGVVCAVAYLVVSLVSGQIEAAAKQRQLEDITAQVQQVAEENAELQRIVDSGDAAAYVEKVAREQGYARPEERLYVDISGQ